MFKKHIWCLLKALQCPFWKFDTLFISSYFTIIVYSVLLVWIRFHAFYIITWTSFLLMADIFINFVLRAQNYDAISNQIAVIVYFKTHVSRCHQSSMVRRSDM